MNRYLIKHVIAGECTLCTTIEAKQLRKAGHETVYADGVRIDLPGDIKRISKRRPFKYPTAISYLKAHPELKNETQRDKRLGKKRQGVSSRQEAS